MYPENTDPLSFALASSQQGNNVWLNSAPNKNENFVIHRNKPFCRTILYGEGDILSLDLSDDVQRKVSSRIDEIDEDIRETKSKLNSLKKKLALLKSATESNEAPLRPRVPLPSLATKIYQENRAKAAANKRSCIVHLPPLYNQPADVSALAEIRKRDKKFRPLLVKYLQKKVMRRNHVEGILAGRYAKLKKVWLVRMLEHEKMQEAYREPFENVFSGLKSHITSRKRGIAGKDTPYRNPAERAVIVPPFLLPSIHEHRFLNTNGIILNMVSEFTTNKCHWMPWEHDLFKQTLIKHGKKFAVLNALFPKKRCIDYYYLTKKKENYKELLSARCKPSKKQKKKRHGPPKKNRSTLEIEVAESAPTILPLSKETEQIKSIIQVVVADSQESSRSLNILTDIQYEDVSSPESLSSIIPNRDTSPESLFSLQPHHREASPRSLSDVSSDVDYDIQGLRWAQNNLWHSYKV